MSRDKRNVKSGIALTQADRVRDRRAERAAARGEAVSLIPLQLPPPSPLCMRGRCRRARIRALIAADTERQRGLQSKLADCLCNKTPNVNFPLLPDFNS